MAQSRDNHFSPSSPHSSSGGADSFKGTPDTRLTAFSPTDGSAKSARLMQNLRRSTSTTPPVRHAAQNYLDSTSPIDKDPFVSPGHRTGLSPTASSFQPFFKPGFIPPSPSAGVIASALSSDLGVSRLVAISALNAVSPTQVEAWLKELDDRGVYFHGTRSIQPDIDLVYIQFDDIRDACSVHASSRLSTREWKLDFAHPKSLQKSDVPQPGADTKEFGQIYIIARTQRGSHNEVFQAIEAVKNSLHPYGQLFAFVILSTCQDGSFRAVAEFCNVGAAVTVAASRINCPVLNEIRIEIALHNPESISSTFELGRTFQAMNFASGEGDSRQNPYSSSITSSRPATSDGNQFSPALGMYPLMVQAPFGPNMPFLLDRFPNTVQTNPIMGPMSPSYPIVGSLYRTPPSPALTLKTHQSPSRSMPGYGKPDARRQNAARINRSPHHNAASHHNHVDIHRIREGIDVRTTIMLRNIPNKVDQVMLKRIVDESSWGKYDFMYLRIDFANDCNVGYAFINFVDPLDIIDFVDARGNQRWNCFKSDKVAEISYATIQGKDCLVQKFRNSSVMLEASHYRPKLYFTSNGPMPELAGQEEPFPEPDNQSKMKRSCENAEHVGLFTPNAGQHFRDEQRRRRSQYDRGTRLAALEEYDYEAAIQHHMYDVEKH